MCSCRLHFYFAKESFFCSIGYSLLWNHSPSEWFSFCKTVALGPSGRQRHGIKIAPGTTSRALSGSVRIQDFMWRTQPGAGCLGDISLPLTGRAIHSLGFHPHRQAGGVQPTVVYPVMGHHCPGGSKTFPGVAVGEDEILGARGDSHPDAVAFPEAIG